MNYNKVSRKELLIKISSIETEIEQVENDLAECYSKELVDKLHLLCIALEREVKRDYMQRNKKYGSVC